VATGPIHSSPLAFFGMRQVRLRLICSIFEKETFIIRLSTQTLSLSLTALVLASTGLLARPAEAQVSFVSSSAGLTGDATFDWTTLTTANPVTPISNPSSLSAGSLNFTLSRPNGAELSAETGAAASGFFLSNGGTNDILVGNVDSLDPSPTLRYDFATAIAGFGASVEWGGVELASYTINAYGAGNSLLFTQTVPSPGAQGNPAFLGVLSSSADITAVELFGTGASAPHSLGTDDPIFQFQPSTSVPEPGTVALLSSALLPLAVVAVRRRRKA
jgi:hypothetical protein